MPAGRPHEYKPEYCEQIVSHMADGLSLTAACGLIGIYRQRVHEWSQVFPELADAVKMGQQLRTAKLEQDMLAADSGPVVTSRIFALKNSAPDEWRDRQSVEHSGPDGGPIQTEDRGAEKLLEFLSGIAERSGATGEAEPE